MGVAKEHLRKISLAEQDVKKSERIFQTDSQGDITGINLNAIMKLYHSYVRTTRAETVASRNHSSRNHRRCSTALVAIVTLVTIATIGDVALR